MPHETGLPLDAGMTDATDCRGGPHQAFLTCCAGRAGRPA